MSDSNVPKRYDWDISGDLGIKADFTKERLYDMYVRKSLIKTQQIFDYEGLPTTIPKRNLELILQTWGFAVLTKVNGEFYVFFGGLGGIPNEYYEPTMAIIANPYLRFSKSLEINDDCVLIRNDSLRMGLMPLINRYAYLQAETDISFKFAAINSRVSYIINALNDDDKESAEIFIENVTKGEKLGVITSLFGEEGVKVNSNVLSPNLIQHLVEMRQYNEGTFLQELGIQSTFNMKREAINEAESNLSNDILFPFIDDMLEQRQIALEEINKKFGLNITVKLSSVWAHNRKNRALNEEMLESQVKTNEEVQEITESDVKNENTTEEGKTNEKKD